MVTKSSLATSLYTADSYIGGQAQMLGIPHPAQIEDKRFVASEQEFQIVLRGYDRSR